MSTVKEHYDNHLGHFYSWMLGDFETRRQEQEDFFNRRGIFPGMTKSAIDLGCGHGIQSIALAQLGFSVKAIDFNKTLLEEFRQRKGDLNIEIIEGDILDFVGGRNYQVDLVICMGDTLTHIPDEKSVRMLIRETASVLVEKGKLILSFRDYSMELSGIQRFIPVRSDEDRILTCLLEYFPNHVMVTDIVHERTNGQWIMKVSSYPKLKLPFAMVKDFLVEEGFIVTGTELIQGMGYLTAQRK